MGYPLKVPAPYINYILANNRCIVGHLYKFTITNGEIEYFTDLDQDVTIDGQGWQSSSLRITGMRRKLAVGLAVDEQQMQIWAEPTDQFLGSNFLQAAEEGILDGCEIVRYRAVWQLVTGNAAFDVATQPPIAVWTLFTGYTSTIDKGGLSHVELKVKSPLVKLEVNMPRNYYQPGCNWTLFSSGCGLIKASYAVTGTIASGLNSNTLPISGGITNLGADGIAQYAQGSLEFLSGVNSGLTVSISNNDASNLYLTYNLFDLPSVGDTVKFWPGCSKSENTCDLKYGNKANFRGFDKVPPIMVSL
jgi:uncharacterized phage protein (TIGR02218 family)